MLKPELSNKTLDLMLRAMMSMAAADGDFNEIEAVTVSAIFEKVSGQPISEDEVRATASSLQSNGSDISADLAAVADGLNVTERDAILHGAYLVLRADGKFDAGERHQLLELTTAMKVPEDEVASVLKAADELLGERTAVISLMTSKSSPSSG